MENIIHKQRVIIIISALFFCASALGFAFLFKIMQKKADSVTKVKEQVASYRENKKIFTDESKKLQALATRTQELESLIIRPDSTPDLLSLLESLAQSKNVKFNITSVQTPEPNTPNAKLIINFSASGPFESLDALLYALEHQNFQIKIQSLALDRNPSVNQEQIPISKEKPKTLSPQWQLVVGMQVLSY